MQNFAHDLGFISSQGAPCGLPACSRNTPHFHCRICGFGTSQIANVVAHARLCSNLEAPQKEYPSVTNCAEGMYPPSSQPFPFYPQVSQTTTSSKMMTTQQSAMFNFVIPPQTPQYGGLYGPQTVFPNPNLFSPSGFNNFSQLDSSWTSRLLTVHPPGGSPSEGAAGGAPSRNSNSPNCCRPDPFGMTSPDKVKDIQPQNWYCGSQMVQHKYPDSTASSCSISLLFLEQTKETDECINVDDLCFTPKAKEPARSSCMQADVKTEDSSSSSEGSDIVVEESDSECSETNDENQVRCAVCQGAPTSNRFTTLNHTSPLTNTSQTTVFLKVSQILNHGDFKESSICGRCLDLINLVDSLEVKLGSAVDKLKGIFKTAKENQVLAPITTENVEESLVCQICDKTFSSPAYLAKHKQHHTKSFSYCCEYCGKGFTGIQKLENHVLLHSKTLRFQCELCGKQFLEKHTLTNHIRQHKGEHKYYCSVCQKGYVQKSVFKSHLLTHSGQFFMCQYCGRKVKTYSNLMVHIKLCSGDLKHECVKCDKKFALKSLLEKHVSVKHKSKFKFECSVCQKGFWKESDLTSHSITHSIEKPFKCVTCGNSYKSKKNLNHHSRLHNGWPNFKCSSCCKEFTRSDALTDHMNQHSGRKPYQCQVCWKRFANRINFNVHVKRHTNERQEKTCPICQKTISNDFKKHMESHSEKKGFSCEKCTQVFAFKNSLNKHMKSKHSVFNT